MKIAKIGGGEREPTHTVATLSVRGTSPPKSTPEIDHNSVVYRKIITASF